MKLVSDFPKDDVLSEILRDLRVQSMIYCYSQLSAPWGFVIDAHAKALPVMDRLRDVNGGRHHHGDSGFHNPPGSFHIVLSGACWLRVEGVERPIPLRRGDLVLLPRGGVHQLSDELGRSIAFFENVLATVPDGGRRAQYGGGGPRTELLCGVFVVENQGALPALQLLPPVVHIPSQDGNPPAWLEAILDLLGQELASDYSGSEALATRLMDVVFAQALRAVQPTSEDIFALGLPALTDQQIVVALRLIRDQPHHAWTATELAARVAMSRSSFTARFRLLTGDSPMRYLARYRLARAADLLRTSSATLQDIAWQTGYSSAVTLSKAFRREFDMSPGDYRRTGQKGAPARPSTPQIVEASSTIG